jgi:hypothetical protein
LKKSATHDQTLLETSAKAEESEGIKREKRFGGRARCMAQTREKPRIEIGSMDDGHSAGPLFWLVFFLTFSLLFLTLSFDNFF